MVSGVPGIDGACHYLSLGISRSAPPPSEALHHPQQADLWAGVTALSVGKQGRQKEKEGKREDDSEIDRTQRVDCTFTGFC